MSSSELTQVLIDRRGTQRAAIAAGMIAAGALAAGATAWYVADSPVLFEPDIVAAARATIIALWVSTGTYLWWRWPGRRVGLLMVGAGFLWAATSLTSSGDALTSTIGRLALALFTVYLMYVFLCFPRNRLATAGERRCMVALAGASVVLWPIALAVMPELPRGGVWSDCGTRCPGNALQLVSTPDWVADSIGVLITGTTALGLSAVAALIGWKAASPLRLRRRAVEPLLWSMAAQIGVYLGFTILRPETEDAVHALRLVGAVSALAIPSALLVGQLRGSVRAASSISRLANSDVARVTHGGIQEFLRDTFGDRSLVLAVHRPEPDQYVTADGAPYAATQSVDRVVTPVFQDGRRVALVEHDEAVEDADVVKGLSVAALTLLRNATLVDELRESRARIVTAADRERRTLERNLHDGAQQRLFALQLRLARARKQAGDGDLARTLAEIEEEAALATSELQALARGIYPPVLLDRGLVDALRAAIAGSPLHVRLVADVIGRLRPEIEAAIYFCIVEAMQNATKHAGEDARLTLTLRRIGRDLEFTVADDGVGFDLDRPTDGVGLVSMRDRIGAVGGSLHIDAQPGGGTAVSGNVPGALAPGA